MKKIICLVVLIMSGTVYSGLFGWNWKGEVVMVYDFMVSGPNDIGSSEKRECGNIGEKINETFLTDLVIPDYFPPDEALLSVIVPSLSVFHDCPDAELFYSCQEHDFCREQRALNGGKSGFECDMDLLNNWQNDCADAYPDNDFCKMGCQATTRGMWEAMMLTLKNFPAVYPITSTIITPLLLN